VFEHPGSPLPDSDGLCRRRLRDDDASIALPPGHRLATSTAPVPMAELRDEAWIRDTGISCRQQLDWLCARAGFTPRIAFDSDDYLTAGRLVTVGVGVALIPDLARDQLGDDLVLRPVRPRATRWISLLTTAECSPASCAFTNVLIQQEQAP
jgi:DNA-binding transcriptional LysR family regulator